MKTSERPFRELPERAWKGGGGGLPWWEGEEGTVRNPTPKSSPLPAREKCIPEAASLSLSRSRVSASVCPSVCLLWSARARLPKAQAPTEPGGSSSPLPTCRPSPAGSPVRSVQQVMGFPTLALLCARLRLPHHRGRETFHWGSLAGMFPTSHDPVLFTLPRRIDLPPLMNQL